MNLQTSFKPCRIRLERGFKKINKKNCIFCGQNTPKKYGKINGVQRYKCLACQWNFLGSKRLNSTQIWQDFSQEKQTYQQLANRYHCSVRTIQRHLKKAQIIVPMPAPRKVNIIMDVTHFKRRFALLGLLDSHTQGGRLFSIYCKCYQLTLAEIIKKGFEIQSITCDGKRGLLNLYPQIPTQMCHFHQVAIMMKNLKNRTNRQNGS